MLPNISPIRSRKNRCLMNGRILLERSMRFAISWSNWAAASVADSRAAVIDMPVEAADRKAVDRAMMDCWEVWPRASRRSASSTVAREWAARRSDGDAGGEAMVRV